MRKRLGAATLVILSLLTSSCAADNALVVPAASTRVPLSDPPDPGPPPLVDGLTAEVRDQIVASTVWVNGLACGVDKEGSGFAVGPDLIATAAHVVAGIENIHVTLVDGRILDAVAVAFDPVNDLALLRVKEANLTPLPLGDAMDGTIGTLIGWERDPRPNPTPFRIDRPITVEIREVGGTAIVERQSWLLAAEVESGDSGAALVDSDGVVVGVAYATTKRNANVAYATRALELVDMIAGDHSTKAEVTGC